MHEVGRDVHVSVCVNSDSFYSGFTRGDMCVHMCVLTLAMCSWFPNNTSWRDIDLSNEQPQNSETWKSAVH